MQEYRLRHSETESPGIILEEFPSVSDEVASWSRDLHVCMEEDQAKRALITKRIHRISLKQLALVIILTGVHVNTKFLYEGKINACMYKASIVCICMHAYMDWTWMDWAIL